MERLACPNSGGFYVAGDSLLACGRSQVQAPAPGDTHALSLHPSFLCEQVRVSKCLSLFQIKDHRKLIQVNLLINTPGHFLQNLRHFFPKFYICLRTSTIYVHTLLERLSSLCTHFIINDIKIEIQVASWRVICATRYNEKFVIFSPSEKLIKHEISNGQVFIYMRNDDDEQVHMLLRMLIFVKYTQWYGLVYS